MPIMINLSQMNVVVIGGGRIATRRVELLLEYASHISRSKPSYNRIFKWAYPTTTGNMASKRI